MLVVCSDVESLVSKTIPDLLKYPLRAIPVVATQIRNIAPCHNHVFMFSFSFYFLILERPHKFSEPEFQNI